MPIVALLCCWCACLPGRPVRADEPAPEEVTLRAAGARLTLQRATGRVVSIRLGRRGEELLRAHPAGSERPFAFVEVVDLREGRTCDPIRSASTVGDWNVTDGVTPHRLVYGHTAPRGRHYVERCMQYLLIWGGTPAESLYRRGRSDVQACRPLTDALVGKRWVFDADPVDLPAGFEGSPIAMHRVRSLGRLRAAAPWWSRWWT